ncbi:type VI secretion system-associated protein TagF [Jiella sp. MQZ9-1]|nr:type VI secretion system-associated protein TagF [Jiella flava]
MASRIAAVHPGFFGKVPSHGDFVAADLDPRFQTGFDAWLQQSLSASRQVLGDRWEQLFLAAPAWRFTLAAELCGPSAMTGVFLPSRDRIGRCFPLVIAARRTLEGTTARIVYDEHWFIVAEAIGRTGLQSDFDLAVFRDKLRRVRPPRDPEGAVGPAATTYGSAWWTAGGPTVRPKEFACDGLPPPDRFLDFLVERPGGRRAQGGAESRPQSDFAPARDSEPAAERAAVSSRQEPENAALSRDADPHPPPPPAGHHDPDAADSPLREARPTAPRTDLVTTIAGAQHEADAAATPQAVIVVNEAAGFAGVIASSLAHRLGPKIVGIVAKVLHESPAHDALDDAIAELKGKLGRVHTLLRTGNAEAMGETSKLPDDFSISLAVAIHRGGRIAALWIGDCRGYLMRDGMMRCLTRDHVEVGMRRRLSRSLGSAQGSAMPDITIETALSGDRLMLCSPSIGRHLKDRAIAGVLLDGNPEETADGLIQEAILAGASGGLAVCLLDLSQAP